MGSATEILPAGAYRDESWYEARRAGITASEIATILGLSRWNSPLALYFTKRGELDEDPTSDRFALGLALESYIMERFTGLTNIETEPCGLLASRENPWQLCTPDGVAAGRVPVELKTSVSDEFWGASGTSIVPLYYRAQLLWQMDVLGSDHGYMCVVFLRTGEPRWYEVGWDAEDIGVMREAGLAFLQRIEDDDPPPADASDATTRALRRVYAADPANPDAVCGKGLRRSYAAALKARREADTRHKLVTNRIRETMGPAVRLRDPDGDIVATRRGPKDALYPGKDL